MRQHCVLLVLAAVAAVRASEKAVLTGSATCEWTNFKYNGSVINTIQYSFKRSSDGSEVVGGKEVFYQRVNSTNGNVAVVLTFKPIRAKDVQPYKCQLWTNESDKVEQTVEVSAPPIPVVDLSSMTIFEGESLTINCTFKSSTRYRLGDYTYRRYEADQPGEIPKNVKIQAAQESITIAVAGQENRGFYTCTATNEVNSTSIKIQLRVKSPLAALWPAIGIFLEVVVLIIIVLVYERRREAAKEQNAGDADNVHNNSREKSKNSSEVRQRGVKG